MQNINNNNIRQQVILNPCTICTDDFPKEENTFIEMTEDSVLKDFDFTSDQNDTIVILKCKHAFHASCIKPWVKEFEQKTTTPKCPNCRAEIVKEPAVNLNHPGNNPVNFNHPGNNAVHQLQQLINRIHQIAPVDQQANRMGQVARNFFNLRDPNREDNHHVIVPLPELFEFEMEMIMNRHAHYHN